MPFLLTGFIRLAWIPQHWVEAVYERATHARLVHVLAPWKSYGFELGLPALVLVGVLVWSLFGERLDSRRELQAALASRPPKVPGGPARCRHCDAALEVPDGALGVRCAYCGADNLVALPERFVQKAKVREASLRLTMNEARKKEAEGRRRVRRAIAWRAPLVLALLWLASPSFARMRRASFSDLVLQPSHMGVYRLVVRQEHAMPTEVLKMYAECGADGVRATFDEKERLAVGETRCDAEGCNGVALVALEAGQTLHLDGSASAVVSLGDRDYDGNLGVLYDSFGEPVGGGALPIAVKAPLSGYYKVDVRGTRGAVVELCVAR